MGWAWPGSLRVNVIINAQLRVASSVFRLTGVQGQPAFTVADVMRGMRLFVRHRFVSFPDSDTSCSILDSKRDEKEKKR